jgi:hypothetical protein
MVMDHYGPKFDPYEQRTITSGTITLNPLAPIPAVSLTQDEVDALRALIAQFREATAAAKKVDELTAQPDCEDPEKIRLQDRVRELEAQLEAVRTAAK